MTSWFQPGKGDELLVEYWKHYKPSLPVGFARSVLSLTFKKPTSKGDRRIAREWNEKQSAEVINRYEQLRSQSKLRSLGRFFRIPSKPR
jgi:hypothetical protein